MESEAKKGANISQAVPFFGVVHMDRSVRYYVDGLGFKMTKKWVHEDKLRWCWLERGGAALMLQEFWKDGHHSNIPTEKLGVGISICFICEDALAIYSEVRSRGIQASKPFVGNGMWVTSLSDPDGYGLDFESYTDVQEGTEFAEEE
ncbi:VOC family protein [Candidatus Poribacteria bacterium]